MNLEPAKKQYAEMLEHRILKPEQSAKVDILDCINDTERLECVSITLKHCYDAYQLLLAKFNQLKELTSQQFKDNSEYKKCLDIYSPQAIIDKLVFDNVCYTNLMFQSIDNERMKSNQLEAMKYYMDVEEDMLKDFNYLPF